jgi:hypothetical protein
VISAVAAGSLLGALLAGFWKIRQRGVMILLVSLALGVCLGSIGLLGKVWSIAGVPPIAGGSRATRKLTHYLIPANLPSRFPLC